LQVARARGYLLKACHTGVACHQQLQQPVDSTYRDKGIRLALAAGRSSSESALQQALTRVVTCTNASDMSKACSHKQSHTVLQI
jgi:hypothetical protein